MNVAGRPHFAGSIRRRADGPIVGLRVARPVKCATGYQPKERSPLHENFFCNDLNRHVRKYEVHGHTTIPVGELLDSSIMSLQKTDWKLAAQSNPESFLSRRAEKLRRPHQSIGQFSYGNAFAFSRHESKCVGAYDPGPYSRVECFWRL